METTKKRGKALKTAAVAAAALLLALSGTFAWTSFSQEKVNEARAVVSANPGGRVHDDFTWGPTFTDKNVYAENYTSTADNGVNVYARIMLKEYLELGDGAGNYSQDPTAAGLTVYPAGKNSLDKSEWAVHKYTDTDHLDTSNAPHKYFEWAYGGSTNYIPTFNKNKDSLEVDVRGSIDDPSTPYSRYIKDLQAGVDYTDNAYYDNDDDIVDERDTMSSNYVPDPNGRPVPGSYGIEGDDFVRTTETHTSKATPTAEVISIADWKKAEAQGGKGSKAGKYWVYDTDGWAYWAEALKPGQATGLLLDNVSLKNPMTESWYYAIDVVGEFVTYGEFCEDGSDHYFNAAKDADKAITADAYALLAAAAAAAGESTAPTPVGPTYTVTATVPSTLQQGATGNASAVVKKDGVQVAPADFGTEGISLAWSMTGAAKSGTTVNASSGAIAIASDEPANATLTVTATLKKGGEDVDTSAGTITVAQKPGPPAAIAALGDKSPLKDTNDLGRSTVTYEGVDYLVLAKDTANNRVLLQRKDLLPAQKFNTSSNNQYQGSSIQTYVNTTYYSTLPQAIRDRIVPTTIKTRSQYNETTFVTSSNQNCFLLSEADVFGTWQGGSSVLADDYTYGGAKLYPTTGTSSQSIAIANYNGSAHDWWLRSPCTGTSYVAIVYSNGSLGINGSAYNFYVRPAFWVNLAS